MGLSAAVYASAARERQRRLAAMDDESNVLTNYFLGNVSPGLFPHQLTGQAEVYAVAVITNSLLR